MSEQLIPNGIIHFSDTDAICKACGFIHKEETFMNRLIKSDSGLIYKKCFGCKRMIGITWDMRGDIVTWEKDKEPKNDRS